jgi:hypothetical protein
MVCNIAREASQHPLSPRAIDVVQPRGQTKPGSDHRRELLITFGGPKVIRKPLVSRYS